MQGYSDASALVAHNPIHLIILVLAALPDILPPLLRSSFAFPSPPIPPARVLPSQSSFIIPLLSFDRASLFGWFGILLAVQRQPVIAHIEARASSFLNYDGVSAIQEFSSLLRPVSRQRGILYSHPYSFTCLMPSRVRVPLAYPLQPSCKSHSAPILRHHLILHIFIVCHWFSPPSPALLRCSCTVTLPATPTT